MDVLRYQDDTLILENPTPDEPLSAAYDGSITRKTFKPVAQEIAHGLHQLGFLFPRYRLSSDTTEDNTNMSLEMMIQLRNL